MWLSQIHEMSVGPLWLLRTPVSSPEPGVDGIVCPSCGLPWLQFNGVDADRVVVMADTLEDDQQQTLLNNCLRAAGWQDAAWLHLHKRCGASDSALQALQQIIAEHDGATLLVLGDSASQLLDPQLQRGQRAQYHGAALIATHHPQQLLNDPARKAEVWADLCLAMSHAQ